MAVEGDSAVLIVEDSENSAATLEIAFLGIPGVSVRMASSGVPRMDGFELIRRIRQNRKLYATPIIVVSADTDPDTPDRIAQLGVSAFFPKPYSPSQVRRKLEQILNATTQ